MITTVRRRGSRKRTAGTRRSPTCGATPPRSATAARIRLPPSERVDVSYVRDLAWSAFTRYEGGFRSTIRINAALPLTVDRAVDLACHEAYPGHHTIATLLEMRFSGRTEFLV